MELETWYVAARRAVDRLYAGEKRLAAALLLDVVYDIKARTEPGFSQALVWAIYPSLGLVSLQTVCQLLNLKVQRVQDLIRGEL